MTGSNVAPPVDPLTAPSSEMTAFRELVRDFALREVAPRVQDYDNEEKLPRDLLVKMGELGLLGGTVPVEWGGNGFDHRTHAALIEELSRVCHILGTLMSMPSGLVGASILKYGTDQQKNQWLRPLAEGKIFGAAGITEPQSGSDVAGLETRYRRDGDDFVLNGRKAWISNLDIASFFVTLATRDRSLRHRGITAFIIPADTPGLKVLPYKNKLGFRPICTGDVVLDEVRLGPEHVLGEIDMGFFAAMTGVERGRLGVAARAVGVAQSCLDETVQYARQRVVGGRPIAELQIVQSKVTDMVVGVESARALVEKAADALDAGRVGRREVGIAKMYASDIAMRSATDAVQVHGAYGSSPDYPVSRYFRDAKVLQIVEGSNDLHRGLIGEMTLGLRSNAEARPGMGR
ncbi:MAG: acyl-CoA dehydrogenase [Hyphomicrobiales bacterium]|nr:MAG: acyl-CoA dehydrogenase [Hyphomicrobiales bacterium]